MSMKWIVCAVLVCLNAGSVLADGGNGNFAKKHPRRAQVLNRANKEESKNNAAEDSGKITQKQDNRLNRQDQRIKREERADAAANGGHITKGEQRDLNRQENRVNKERNRMEKRDAAISGSAPTGAATTPGQ